MTTTLDHSMPYYHFGERHSRWMPGNPHEAWQALTTLTLDRLTISRLLVAARYLRVPPPGRPLLDGGPVRMLEKSAPWYALGGNIARPWQRRPQKHPFDSLAEFVEFAEPGWIKYLVDFRLRPVGGGVRLTTVTRIVATDRAARLRFAPYWAVIRPASGVIRRDMLAAVARTARHAATG